MLAGCVSDTSKFLTCEITGYFLTRADSFPTFVSTTPPDIFKEELGTVSHFVAAKTRIFVT